MCINNVPIEGTLQKHQVDKLISQEWYAVCYHSTEVYYNCPMWQSGTAVLWELMSIQSWGFTLGLYSNMRMLAGWMVMQGSSLICTYTEM